MVRWEVLMTPPLDVLVDEKGVNWVAGFTLIETTEDELRNCVPEVTLVEFPVAKGSETDTCGLVFV